MKENLLKPLNKLRGKDPCGIYKLMIKDKIYIGSSLNIKKRLRQHRRELRKNIHDNIIMQNAFNKYNECFYEILEELESSIDNLKLRGIESKWINLFKETMNIQDPVSGIGGVSLKTVYQYDLNGVFIKEWSSVMEASRKLNISHAPIHTCANPKIKQSKSAHGFIWSYTYLNDVKYINNTGSNLEKVPVYLYKLSGEFYKEFDSLSNTARWLKEDINYDKDWTYLRSSIGYALKNSKTRTVRKKYKVSYIKKEMFNDTFK